MRFSCSRVVCCLLLLTVPAYADCAADIRAVVQKTMDSGPYTAVTTSKAGNVTTGILAQIDADGDMHSWTNEGAETNELIMLDGRTWTKTMGQWQEILPSVAQDLAGTVARDRMAFLEGIEHPLCSGRTVVQDETFLSYSFALVQAGVHSASTLLVDSHTKMLSRMLTRTLAGGETTRSVTTFSFGATFEIEAPTD